jgi:site-specific recombinase XerD
MNLITSSDYYGKWNKYIKLENSTKKQYTYVLEHFGDYLLKQGFTLTEDEKLDFDKELFFYNNKPLTTIKLNKILKLIASKTTIKRKLTCHDLRATMAYLLYIKGVNERVIQSQLRHKKLSTTLLYLPVRNKLLT